MLSTLLIGKRTHRSFTRVIVALLSLFLLLIALANCGGSAPVQSPTPTPIQFTTIDLKLPAVAVNAPVVGPLPDGTPMHLGITFKINQAALDKLNTHKVAKGQSTNLEGAANQLGISDATYTKIKAFLGIEDATLKLGKLHTYLNVDAKAATVAKLFQTHFVQHKLNGRTFYLPATPPKLPTFIANQIAAITGLESYSMMSTGAYASHPFDTKFPGAAQRFKTVGSGSHRAADCTAPDQTVVPQNIAHAYGYDQLYNNGWHGENMTVNLVEIGGVDQSDLQNYFACVNFPSDHLKIVDVDAPPTQPDGESTLDIDMIAGLAPSINIVDYETDGGSFAQFNDELQQIINDNANNSNPGSIVSISLGAAEDGLGPDTFNAVDQAFQTLVKAEHMTVFVASGDCGAFTDRVYKSLSVSFSASDPWATAVGGTMLSVDGNGNRTGEVVWSDSSNTSTCDPSAGIAWGSGGGLSTFFQRPSWQQGAGVDNQSSTGSRQLPDVAAIAFGLPVYFQGQWGDFLGTSAATPIWATGLALVNQGLLQQKNSYVYGPDTFYVAANNSNGSRPYYDVTSGDNLYYQATPGWDYDTGLGTPNMANFYQVVSNYYF